MGDPIAYDKAKYHHGGDYPGDLAESQAFVQTGLYLGWLIENGRAFLAREMTGPEIYAAWDGALVEDTWENYSVIRSLLDDRFKAWKRRQDRKWWQLWK